MLGCLVGMILFAGCSVKEDREACPCRLVLDFSEIDVSVIQQADLTVAADGGFVFTDVLYADDLGSVVHVTVPRASVEVGVWSGCGNMLIDNGLEIPVGVDCPPVYFHVSTVDADCEMVRELVVMRRNHCRMSVRLNNMESDAREINVYGNVDGYHADGTPSVGEFVYGLPLDGNGGEVILPRQVDNSLSMVINDGSGVLKHFAIGEYIAGTGYDWNEPDLKDITVEIDISFAKIALIIQGWDEVYRFEVVI